ncbi:hypothetical protein [Winogradskyella sp.]|uniref:hypothetical protein n=1 Tax=Winogradskyella sp. TaxID=1883156 RepID=UPI00260FF10C|nr:hypothetical protein [Winogradskyella sp.]
MEENNILPNNPEHSGQVSLPFNENQFKDFIVSLLGKPQTITKHLRGKFEIDKNNLTSIFEIINQRIYQQNDAKLIQFRASIYYNDNTTVTLNGYDHLVNYNEKLPLISQAVHLTWQYLVKFKDKGSFEKQEIALSFITETDGSVPFVDETFARPYYDSGVSFRISHTGRTWGADIEAILTKHLETLVQKESKFVRFFKYNSDSANHVLSAILVGITLFFAIFRTERLRLINANNEDSLFWIHHYGSYIFLFFGIYFLYRITMILLEEFQYYGAPSFVLLTPESEKYKTKRLSSYRKEVFKYIGTLVISIIIGLVTNILYNHFLNK